MWKYHSAFPEPVPGLRSSTSYWSKCSAITSDAALMILNFQWKSGKMMENAVCLTKNKKVCQTLATRSNSAKLRCRLVCQRPTKQRNAVRQNPDRSSREKKNIVYVYIIYIYNHKWAIAFNFENQMFHMFSLSIHYPYHILTSKSSNSLLGFGWVPLAQEAHFAPGGCRNCEDIVDALHTLARSPDGDTIRSPYGCRKVRKIQGSLKGKS